MEVCTAVTSDIPNSNPSMPIENSTENGVDIDRSTKADDNTADQPSKRQLKKDRKKQMWEETKLLRKEHRRKKKQEQNLKRKCRLEQLRIEAEKCGLDPSKVSDPPTRKKLKSNSMKNSTCKVGICIDMSFTDLMNEKDLHACIKQISRCYSSNRRFSNPVQLHVTNFGGAAELAMEKHDGWRNWDMNIHSDKSYLELDEYPKDRVVYLTAESENVLKEPEDGTLYVIGGLVDHNSRKGMCHNLAVEKGIRTARLPLGEYIEMNRRKVLSILHVFEIVGGVAQNRPWQEVIMEVLPSRNQAKLKQHGSDEENGSSDSDEEPISDTPAKDNSSNTSSVEVDNISTSTT